MTTLIKSNVELKQVSVFSRIAKTPVLSMDFSKGEYTKSGVNVSDSSLLIEELTQLRSGYYDNNYNYHFVDTAHKLNISHDPDALKKGLLVDGQSGNAFINSNSPKTQTVKLYAGINRVGYVAIFYVEGSGELLIRRTNGGDLLGRAADGKPYYHLLTSEDSANTFSFYTEVVGDLSFVQVFASDINRRLITKTKTVGKAEGSPAASVKVKQSVLDEVLPTRVGTMFIKTNLGSKVWSDNLPSFSDPASVMYVGSTTEGLYIGVKQPKNGYGETVHVMLIKGVGDNTTYTSDAKDTVSLAATFSSNGVKVAYNGKIIAEFSIPTVFPQGDVFIGSAPNRMRNSTNIVEQFALYDTVLTDAELAQLTS